MQSSDEPRGAEWAFEQYEAVRSALPYAELPNHSDFVPNLSALQDRFNTFLLDAFGILNVGERAIPGAIERMAELRNTGKRLLVLSNSASYPSAVTAARYRALGFDFSDKEVVTSRDALKVGLRRYPQIRWGVAAMHSAQIDELGVNVTLLQDDPTPYRDVDGFILLSSSEWTDARQSLLVDALVRNARPVLVGNPDIVAPRETALSLEPGYYAHDLASRAGIKPAFFGKPFSNIFELAVNRLDGFDLERTAMVGDTLHTDVLGGAAAKLQTVLVTDHGLFAGTKVDSFIKNARIVPHFICRTT